MFGRRKDDEREVVLEHFCRDHGLVSWFERKSRGFRANARLFCFEESNEADFTISWCVVHHWVQRTKEFKRWLFWFVEEMYSTVPQGKYKINSQNACSATLFINFSQVVQLDILTPGWFSLTWAYLSFIYLDYDTEKSVEMNSHLSLPAVKSDAKNAVAHVLFLLCLLSVYVPTLLIFSSLA